MRKISFSILLVSIFLITLVSADQQFLGTFDQNDTIQLKQICANCTYNNITSIYVQGVYQDLLSDVVMQKSGSEYNYTFSQTQTIGTYVVSGIGDPDGTPTIWNYTFTIGKDLSIAVALFYVVLLALSVFGFIMIIYFGVTTQHLFIKTFSVGFGYLFVIAISFIAWRMAADFISSAVFLVSFFKITFIVVTIGFFPLLVSLFVYGVYMMLTIKEIQDMMERGIPESEATERARWKK